MSISDLPGATGRRPATPRGAVRDAVAAALDRLPPAERRVAEAVLRDPEAVAFGTVARIALQAGTSGPSVVRLADRLGYAGFLGLQEAVRRDLRHRLRPAVERIRSASAARTDVLPRALEVELANVRLSLGGLDPGVFEAAVARLASARTRITVMASEQFRGIGLTFAGELGIVRDGVRLVDGSPFRVASQLARLRRGDTAVLLDLRRHETWLLDAARQVEARGAARIALVDSELSPLARGALAVLPVAAEGAGPFDSHVGMLAVANALVAGVAARLRRAVTRRLDALESTWVATGVLAPD